VALFCWQQRIVSPSVSDGAIEMLKAEFLTAFDPRNVLPAVHQRVRAAEKQPAQHAKEPEAPKRDVAIAGAGVDLDDGLNSRSR
jgi:hypothetical protein